MLRVSALFNVAALPLLAQSPPIPASVCSIGMKITSSAFPVFCVKPGTYQGLTADLYGHVINAVVMPVAQAAIVQARADATGVIGPLEPASSLGKIGIPSRHGKDGATGASCDAEPVRLANIASNLSDAYSTVTPAGQRDEWMMNGTVHSVRSFNGAGSNTNSLNILSDSFGRARNLGTYTHPDGSGAFSTSDSTAVNIMAGSSASEITGGINMSFQHYGYNGDSHPFYVYDNFMPGTATAGSDEGHAAIRVASVPSATFKATVSSDAGNTPGASALRFVAPAYCGGSGSSFGINTCLGAGGWMLDKTDPIYTNLHMTAFKGTTPQSPMLVTVAETLAVTPFVTSMTSLDAADVANGDTQTFPVILPVGFVPPTSGHTACLSAFGENIAEEVGYTLNGSTITFTGHRQPHYVPSGGLMHIALGSCGSAVWRQDAADNAIGSTGYVVLGAIDAHTLAVAVSSTGSRSNGSIGYGKSIQADGATLGAFDIFPAAFVVDVLDPAYSPVAAYAPRGIYSYGPLYAHLGTNTVPWFTGKQVEEAYYPADTFYQQRYECNTPLADTTIGSACNYTEVRGSVQRWAEVVLTNSVGSAARRGRPDVIKVRPYNYGGLGTYSHLAGTDIAPTDGWLVSTHSCGESLLDPAGCPDHTLWEEGSLGKIAISGKNKTLTFTMGAVDPEVHFTFLQGVRAFSLHAKNGFTGTCATGKMTVVDGIVTGCAP